MNNCTLDCRRGCRYHRQGGSTDRPEGGGWFRYNLSQKNLVIELGEVETLFG